MSIFDAKVTNKFMFHAVIDMHGLAEGLWKAWSELIIIIIIIIPWTIFIVWSIRRQAYARVHFGLFGRKSVSAGGIQLVGQAANLTSEGACYMLIIRPSPLLLLNHKVDTHLPSLGGWKAESA